MANSRDFFTPPDARIFYQVGGTRPGQPYEYLGCGQTMDTEVTLGEGESILCQSLLQRGAWDIIGQKYAPPELNSTGISMYMPRQSASVLERTAKTKCFLTFQAVVGRCDAPNEFNAWESKFLFEFASLSSLSIPALASVLGDNLDAVMMEGAMRFSYWDRILPMRFSERAKDEILAEVLDGIYCGGVSCGDCGPYSEGCDHLYVITRANPASPGLSGQLVYTNDGVNFYAVDIPTLGGLDPSKIACIGNYIAVISEAAGNLQYAERNEAIVAADWIENADGFVALHGPRCIYVKSPNEVFIGGAAGYIYGTPDYQNYVEVIEAGVLTGEDFNEIDGDGADTIVAVADNNVVVVSTNSGETFGLIVGPQAGADLQAVSVLDQNNWVVGGDAGAFYYTNDAGVTWHAIGFLGAGAGAIIHDVKFSAQSPTIGYAAMEIGGRGYVYRTTDGGTRWFRDEPSITGLANNARVVFAAPCPNNINVVATGGLAAAGTDGFLAVAE